MASDGCQCCRDAEYGQWLHIRRGSAIWLYDLDGQSIGRKAPDVRPFQFADHPLGDEERPSYVAINATKLVANLVTPTEDHPGRIYVMDRGSGYRQQVYEFRALIKSVGVDSGSVIYCVQATEDGDELCRLDADGEVDAAATELVSGRIVFDTDGTLLVLPVEASTEYVRATADLATLTRGYSQASQAADLATNGEVLRYGSGPTFYRDKVSWVNDQASLAEVTHIDTLPAGSYVYDLTVSVREGHSIQVGDTVTLYYVASGITESQGNLEVTAIGSEEVELTGVFDTVTEISGTPPEVGQRAILERFREITEYFTIDNPGLHIGAAGNGEAYLAISAELIVRRIDVNGAILWELDVSEELASIQALASADADGVFVAGPDADLADTETALGLNIDRRLLRISSYGELVWNVASPAVINPHSLVYDRAAQELFVCGQVWPPHQFAGVVA